MTKESLYQMVRYFLMALVIVVVEVVSFVLLNNFFGLHYSFATILSVAVAIILNWYFSRIFVFKKSRYNQKKEFIFVGISSLIGMGIQLTTTVFLVEILNFLPIIGKIIAIGVTFFWNFWVRKKFIFS